MVYAVQGTGQSSPDADPSKDAGFLSQVLHPAITAARGDMDRAYVPYDAGFGGAVAGGEGSVRAVRSGRGRQDLVLDQGQSGCVPGH